MVHRTQYLVSTLGRKVRVHSWQYSREEEKTLVSPYYVSFTHLCLVDDAGTVTVTGQRKKTARTKPSMTADLVMPGSALVCTAGVGGE